MSFLHNSETVTASTQQVIDTEKDVTYFVDDDDDWCAEVDLGAEAAIGTEAKDKEMRDSNHANCIDMSNDEVQKFISEQDNRNTQRKTLNDTQRFEKFLRSKNECRNMTIIPPDELDAHVANFVLSMRRADGGEYEPTTLRAMVGSIDRKLKRIKYECTIFSTSDKFLLTKQALKAKNQYLKKLGKGNRPNAAKAISDDEIETLYTKGLLGTGTPESLLNTLWLNNSTHFGMRGVTENYHLRWGDVQLRKASDGVEYLELNERQTKTRTGEHISNVRPVTPKMYASGGHNCPVECYTLYATKRPANFSNSEHPFYLATRTVAINKDDDQWFTKQRVGAKKLGCLLKKMAEKGNLDPSKRLTSHSMRKRLVQKLRSNNIAPTDIMQKRGHKNVQSVINYSEMDEQNRRRCSHILSDHGKHQSTDTMDMTNTFSGYSFPAFPTSNPKRPSDASAATISSDTISSATKSSESESIPEALDPVPHPPILPMLSMPRDPVPVSTGNGAGNQINTMSVSSQQWQQFHSTFYGANLHINTMNVYSSNVQSTGASHNKKILRF